MYMKQFNQVSFLIICFILIKTTSSDSVPKSKVLKCAVCQSLVHELRSAILKVDPRKKVEVGSFRLKPDGDQVRSLKKYAGSEAHMTELLEKVCGGFTDYAQARHKDTNKVEVIKLVENGMMNPRFTEYEMIQDPELNKGVQYHCESIVEDFEDDIVSYFTDDSTDIEGKEDEELKKDFCFRQTKICEGVKEEL